MWDERIDNSDIGAEEAIRYYISTLGAQEKQSDDPDITLDILVNGNAMLYINSYSAELSDSGRRLQKKPKS